LGVIRRQNEYQGLGELDVLIDDDSHISKYFNIMELPDSLTQGKTSFLIAGSELLKPNVEVKIEIIDASGNSIYTEAVSGYKNELPFRRVSIEVYQDTVPGDATMHVVGELLHQGEVAELPYWWWWGRRRGRPPTGGTNVPRQWRNHYNVRWSRSLSINSAGINSQPILFYKQPVINTFEIVKGYVETIPITGSFIVTGSAKLAPVSPPAVPIEPPPPPLPSQPPFMDPMDRIEMQNAMITKIKRMYRGNRKRGFFGNLKRLMRFASPPQPRALINITSTGVGEATASSQWVGGTVTFNNPQPVDGNENSLYIDGSGSRYTWPSVYTSSIQSVNNNLQFVPENDFLVLDTQSGIKYPSRIGETYFTASYEPYPGQELSTTHFRSFADIRLSDLRTFSGDVFRVKVYAKSDGTFGDYEPIYDSPIETPELLTDTFSITGETRIGGFLNQDDIDVYWTGSGAHSAKYLSGSQDSYGEYSDVTLTYNSSKIVDSMYLSGSNYTNGYRLEARTTKDIDFVEGVPYTLRYSAHGVKGPKNWSEQTYPGAEAGIAYLSTYLSGSAFAVPVSRTWDRHHGKRIGHLSTQYEAPTIDIPEWNYGIVETTIYPDKTGTGTPVFVSNAGSWHISDISITPATETSFNPEFIQIVAPMNMEKRPDTFDFLVEFYDLNNNVAESITFKDNIPFNGAPLNIDGSGNLFSGSICVGNVVGEGIEMYGGNSAYIRSIGYEGFSSASEYGLGGFVFFSGSILPDSGDDYKGVGLELHDGNSGSMIFRTDPSKFEVRTDRFFFGREDTMFVSGADSLLEISSSNFHLTPEGDVIMRGTVYAEQGQIAGWKIITGSTMDESLLSGSNIVLDASRSMLYKADQGPGSDGSAPFSLQSDEYYVDFTPADQNVNGQYYVKFGPNFAVSHSGFLYASGAVFEGTITASAGLIGGFHIETSSLYSDHIFISGSPLVGGVDDPRYMFISTSNFNVKENGDISGSNVLFDGGTIGGWTINTSSLESTNLAIESEGTIRTKDYVTNQKGWIITSADDGFAEFGNVKVRGTLGTTTFEKESVNAVGGQLWIANSTVITSSGTIPDSETTWSVENASGWAEDEIVVAKKLTDTGFAIEYVKIESSSQNNPDSNNDYTGHLYVERAYGNTETNLTGSVYLAGTASISQSYEPGQVIVSTGRYISGSGDNTIGTGYMRMNANPSDPTTPYIDIAERTGSGVYDVKLTTRLGDLSGISPDLLYGETEPGFGLFTENIFLQGAIRATTGSFSGRVHAGTGNDGKGIVMGNDVDESGSAGLWINPYNKWFDNGDFRLGDEEFYFSGSTDGKITLHPRELEVSASGLEISSTQKSMSLGDNREILLDDDGGTGGVPIIRVDGGEIVAGAGSAFKVETDGTMSASSAWFSGHIQAYSGELHELFIKNEVVLDDAAGKIRTDDNSVILTNTSFTMTSGDITLGSPAKLYLKDSGQITASAALITGSDVNIDVENFSAKGDSVYISSSNFLLENGNISASNVNLAGHVTAETGNIGGWVVEAGRLYSTGPSGGTVALDANRSGFVVKNAYGKDRVYVGDKSLGEITGSANESTNGSFEVTGSNAQDVPGWRIETTNSATYAVTSSQDITVDLLSLLKIENPAGTAP
jgi:hypothetical protein